MIKLLFKIHALYYTDVYRLFPLAFPISYKTKICPRDFFKCK